MSAPDPIASMARGNVTLNCLRDLMLSKVLNKLTDSQYDQNHRPIRPCHFNESEEIDVCQVLK